jgi:zinc transport system permease protein
VSMLELAFMQKALIACTAVSLVAPVVGTFVVQRRQSLLGDGMGHVAFAGVGVAFLAGFAPLWGAVGLVIAAAVVLWWLQRSGMAGDLALAMIFYGGIALGYLLMHRSGLGFNSVIVLLFGSPLNLEWGQVWSIVGLAAVVLVGVLALYRPLVATAFDEEAARVGGIRTERLALALTIIIGLIVVGGMYALGLLLIAAMLVVPVAAAAQVARSYRGTMLLASAVGGGSALIGLTLAFYVDLTPGASIVLTAIGWYLVATVARHTLGRTRDPAIA